MQPGDTLVVPSLDRLSRSPQEPITTVAELRRREIGFTSLHESLDTTTPGDRLVFHVFAALAEFIISGTREDLAAARAHGRVSGRPTVITPEILRAARDPLPNPEGNRTARSMACRSDRDLRRPPPPGGQLRGCSSPAT
jgi:DNA invertase Pin-like site-specific DNA recombinase